MMAPWEAVVGVDDGAVLHIRVFADFDSLGVATNHDERPDGGAFLERDVTADEREFVNEHG